MWSGLGPLPNSQRELKVYGINFRVSVLHVTFVTYPFMLSTVTRCTRQIRWPCYQKIIPHRAQNITRNTQKWHAHSRKYSQLPERNIVGVRNESSESTDGQMNFWLGLGVYAGFCSIICSCGSWFSILLSPWEDTTCRRAGWVSPKVVRILTLS